MASRLPFAEEELAIDESLGYPRVYAKLCRKPNLYNPYCQGPPFTFTPYILNTEEASGASDLDLLFPIVDSKGKPSANLRNYVNLLWKQLNHLGNAGFDPAKFRVDTYGNVLYFYADSGSPLAWEIDHWFPCSRGGRTVPSNLRLLQWQVCKRKQNKLEFLIPWWDLQLGISVNQFLTIFALKNSDFRNRAFSFLFLEGENEELNDSQVMESHAFPQHFIEMEQKVGLAPAAIVGPRKDSDPSALKSVDVNRPPRPNSPANVARKFTSECDEALCKEIKWFVPSSKENDNYKAWNNPYLAFAMARDSVKQRGETNKKQAEMKKLEDELNELKEKTETQRLSVQDLESMLIKRRRGVEKCRRLVEAQSSYRALLEKMIRDAMHQSVVYKEQIRLNQAASTALMARLEAQNAICDSSEKELQRKFRQRDDIESQIRPYWEQARKRSRVDDALSEERCDKSNKLLPGFECRNPLQKELRLFLKEEQKVSEAGISLSEDREREQEEIGNKEPVSITDLEGFPEDSSLITEKEETRLDEELQKLAIKDQNCQNANKQKSKKKKKAISLPQSPQKEEDEEYRKKVGKGNLEKWLQMLLENSTQESSLLDSPWDKADEYEKNTTQGIVEKLNLKNPQDNIKITRPGARQNGTGPKLEESNVFDPSFAKQQDENRKEPVVPSRSSFEWKEMGERNGKARKGLLRSESARIFRPIPSSPSVILGMTRGVDCIGKKPMVIGDDDEDRIQNHVMLTKFMKYPIKTCAIAFKKAVRK